MKVVEQIKDSYGNLIQLWGVYRIREYKNLDPDLPNPRKKDVKILISTHNTLSEARRRIK